jgi:hypothetical protein
MIDLSNQPFLLSLKQTAKQKDDTPNVRNLLKEHQNTFREYVFEHYKSDLAAPKRYQFLKTADYTLNKIRKKYADRIKENNAAFYDFWAWMIDDVRSYIAVFVETLEFQRKCPAHMLSEPVQSFPPCIWTAQKIDLKEAIKGLYEIDAIRLQDGSRPSFPLFAQSIGSIFGIKFDDPVREHSKVLIRKRNQTSFFERIITVLKYRDFEKDDLKG